VTCQVRWFPILAFSLPSLFDQGLVAICSWMNHLFLHGSCGPAFGSRWPLHQNLQMSPTSAKTKSLLGMWVTTVVCIFNLHCFPGYSEISCLWKMLFSSIDEVWRSSVLACTYNSSAVFQTLLGILLADLILTKLCHLNKEKCKIPTQGINQIFHLGSLMKNNNEFENFEVVRMFFLFWSLVLEKSLHAEAIAQYLSF